MGLDLRCNADPAFRQTNCMKRIFLSLLGLTLFASASFAQNVTVTGSTGANATYATLKAAFDALNANTNQTGNTITVSVVGNTTETASAVLNQPAGGSRIDSYHHPRAARDRFRAQ